MSFCEQDWEEIHRGAEDRRIQEYSQFIKVYCAECGEALDIDSNEKMVVRVWPCGDCGNADRRFVDPLDE